MDEQLKHLKESMDRTVLRNGTFRPEEKQNILRAIQNQKRPRRKKRWGVGFSIAISFCLIIGLAWLLFTQFQQGQTKDMASESFQNMPLKDSTDASSSQKSSANNQAVQQYADRDTHPFMTMPKKDDDPTKPFYTYIVMNHYYFKETGEMVNKNDLGQEIGRIKRTGEWKVIRSGDSNDVKPGPIYAIHGKDPATYIAAEGSIIRDGKMEVGYLIFKKFTPVER